MASKKKLHVRKILQGEFRVNGMRDGVSFLWDRVEAKLCRFSGIGPFVHDPLYNNLLPKEHRIRVKIQRAQPVNIKTQVSQPNITKRPLAHLKIKGAKLE